MLDKVHAATARAILPVFRTTPSPALLREAGLPPAVVALDNIARKADVRVRKLDSRHPLFQRGQKSLSTPAFSRFARSQSSIPASDQYDSLIFAPWELQEPLQDSLRRINGPSTMPEHRVHCLGEFVRKIPPADIVVYFDGYHSLVKSACAAR